MGLRQLVLPVSVPWSRRVNVYGEELTDRIEIIEKEVEGNHFYGVRFWLKFPNQPWWIHRKVQGEEDDDSTAITIWGTMAMLEDILRRAYNTIVDFKEDNQ